MAEEIITSTNVETATDHEYNASEIQVLKGLEAVRKRPGMYIGSTGERGLHHLVYEIVDNAIDEALAGYCNHIEVKILKNNIIQVTDNGRGIPVDIQADTGLPAVTVVYTILHAGGKFGGENSGYKVAGGLHGVGASVVNACSEWLTVNVRRDGHEYEQTFRRGDPDGPLKCHGHGGRGGHRHPRHLQARPGDVQGHHRLQLRDAGKAPAGGELPERRCQDHPDRRAGALYPRAGGRQGGRPLLPHRGHVL